MALPNINSAQATSGSQLHGNNSAKTLPSFPLHFAVQNGRIDDLIHLLNSPTSGDPFSLDYNKRSVLHHAANYGHQQSALDMATAILNCKFIGNDTDKKTRLVNLQDANGETILHYAARIGHTKLIELFLFAAADVNLKSLQGVEPIELIYAKTPHAMCAVFDTAIHYKSGDVGEDNFEILVDFGPIVGYPTAEDDEKDEPFHIESSLLAFALKNSGNKCKQVLVHPLVQIFLEFKWNKVRPLFWASIILHTLWFLAISTFLVDLYLSRCPFLTENIYNSSQQSTTIIQCPEEKLPYALAAIAILTSVVMSLKQIFELRSSPSIGYFFGKLENLGQLLLIFLVILTTLPILTFLVGGVEFASIHDWNYIAAAIGVFLAWTLILCQVGKTPRLGLYVEILLRVLKSFGLFILTFASLLIAFAFSFSIIMPRNETFSSWPLALSKMLVMMTGELNYDEFHRDGQHPKTAPFFVMGHLLFIAFTMIVTIILFNLLIGLTVSDIQGLRAGANVSLLSARLEQIYVMESFIFSKQVKCFTNCFNINPNIFRKFQIASMAGEEDYLVTLPKKLVPKDILAQVKEIAMQNINLNKPSQKISRNLGSLSNEDFKSLIKTVVTQVLEQHRKESEV